jgi:hypothetical protein
VLDQSARRSLTVPVAAFWQRDWNMFEDSYGNVDERERLDTNVFSDV